MSYGDNKLWIKLLCVMGVRRELRDYFFNGGVNQLQFTHSDTGASPPPLWRGILACDPKPCVRAILGA